jgi:hypothetical protein
MENMIQMIIDGMLRNITIIFNTIKDSSYIPYHDFESWQKILLHNINWLSKHRIGERIIEQFTDMLNMISDILFR